MLGNNNANIKAIITADDRASATLSKFGSKVGSVSRTAKLAIAAAGAAAVAFGVSSVKAFEESENAIAQTNAVLRSTKGIAGVTAQQVTELATALQKTTKYSDEEVRSAENLLLTFTSITKDIFPDAIHTVLNMSAALGQDLKSSSIQLGKALQDPIRGVTALRRVGVNFSQAQVDVIKKLVETGKSAQAQQLIIKELSTEFGGSAAAAADTYAGKIAILKNRFNDLQESIGKKIVDVLGFLTGGFGAASNKAKEFSFITGGVTTIVDAHTQAINRQKTAINELNVARQNNANQREAVVASHNAIKLAQEALNAATNKYGANSKQASLASEDLRARQSDLAIQEARSRDATNELKDKKWDLKKANDAARGSTSRLKDAQNKFGSDLTKDGGVIDIVDSFGKHMSVAFGDIDLYIGDLERAIDKGALVLQQGGSLAGLSFGTPEKKQMGGPIFSRKPYLVGERGPEIVVPQSSGQVIPNHKLGISESGSTINLHVNIGMYAGSEIEKRKVAKALMDAYQDLAKSKNMTAAELLS